MTTICSNQRALNSPYAKKLSEDQCRKLYWACLEILERTGVQLFEQEAVDLLKKAGAHVNDGNRVRIAGKDSSSAKNYLPSNTVWYRPPQNDIFVGFVILRERLAQR